MSVFIQIVILIAVLAVMTMVLLAIRQLTHFDSFDDADETSFLKKEVEDEDKVMSEHSIFHNLVDFNSDKDNVKKKNYKSTSKEPFSRKE